MVKHSTNKFRPGLKIIVDQNPCDIIETEFCKPGKGQAFTRVKLRNLKSNCMLEKTYKSGVSVEEADVVEVQMQYLYHDNDDWYFMNQITFEQYAMGREKVEHVAQWLQGNEICLVILWDGVPLSVTAPNFVTLQIIDTVPGIQGDTVSRGSKSATLLTGVTIKVPLFIENGDYVKVDTRIGEYVGRVKE